MGIISGFDFVCAIFFFASPFTLSYRHLFRGIISSFVAPLPRPLSRPKYRNLPSQRGSDAHRTVKTRKKKKDENKKPSKKIRESSHILRFSLFSLFFLLPASPNIANVLFSGAQVLKNIPYCRAAILVV